MAPSSEPNSSASQTECPAWWAQRLKNHDSKTPGPKAFWLESSATPNVEDYPPQDFRTPASSGFEWVDAQQAIHEMVEVLETGEDPQLLIMVHGFNNPQDVVHKRYLGAFDIANNDERLKQCHGLVCVGYRWPSEQMLKGPIKGAWSALPSIVSGIMAFGFCIAALAALLRFFLGDSFSWIWRSGYFVSLAILAFPCVAYLLRIVVYYRDVYRATHYGVPDLVEFIREIDKSVREAAAARGNPTEWENRKVKLTFIGHSMGAFVVTQTVRIISDVFDTRAIQGVSTTKGDNKILPPEVGNVFRLERLVLVSPDIPAETLMIRRSNFLASSLRRFREVYIFSNGGDAVLRMISTLANYFSFPNRYRRFGFRLGNIEVIGGQGAGNSKGPLPDSAFGIVNLDELIQDPKTDLEAKPVSARGASYKASASHRDAFLAQLRVGERTLKDLHEGLTGEASAKTPAGKNAPVPDLKKIESSELPLRCTYFDCTDTTEEGSKVGLVSGAKRKAQLSSWDHWRLLLSYGHILPGFVDVHSGYFSETGQKPKVTEKFIYGLACLGLRGVLGFKCDEDIPAEAWQERLRLMSATCAQSGFKVLLSPEQVGPDNKRD